MALINGNPAVAYYDATNGDLKYIRATDATGTTWGTPQTVDSANDVGQYPSLITVNGRPAISYHDVTNGDLRYVRASDANGAAWGAPITVHSAGDTGHFTSMCVVNGNPAIAFYDVALKELEYMRATDVDGATWPVSHTIVDTTTGNDVGQYASLAVVNGNPAISYYDAQNKDLLYVRATDVFGTAWGSSVLVDAGGGAVGTGQYTSLVVVNGNPAISYHDAQNAQLHYILATDASGTTWPTSTPVVVDTGGDTGHYTAMTIVGGMPVISYYDVTNGDLHYIAATNATGTAWPVSPVNVDSTGNVGQFTSIVALGSGSVGVSYYDVTNGDLKYARLLPPPTVTSVTPSVGTISGGTLITIVGTGFTGATAVTIGGVAVTSFIVVDDFTITATVAAGTAGQKDVAVTAPTGTGTATNAFTYADYSVTTSGGAIVVTDLSGNSDTLSVSETLAGTAIRFAAAGRTFSVNGGAGISGNSGDLLLSGVTSITVNAEAGADTISVGAFTAALPSLTINGGKGDDTVDFTGDITFVSGANLDVDLQNDDPTPGTDIVNVATNANILTSGTGAITVKVSKTISMLSGSSFETVSGGITLAANQQVISSTGTFAGILIRGTLQSSGSGAISVAGIGGDTGASNFGVAIGVESIAPGFIASTGGGTVTIVGQGGAGSGGDNDGIALFNAPTDSSISSNGNITLTGIAGAVGVGNPSEGLNLTAGPTITATGSATITLIADTGLRTDSTITASSTSVTLRQRTNGTTIDIGTYSASSLGLSDAGLDHIACGTLNIGDSNSGAITQTAAITRSASTQVNLVSGSTIAINTGALDTAGGDLSVDPGGATNAFTPAASGTDVSLSTTGTLSFGSGDKLAIAINGTTVDSGYQQLKVTGKVNLTGAVLSLGGSYTPTAGETFTIINNDSTDAVTGTFTGLAEGSSTSLNGVSMRISYVAGDGNDVVLTAMGETVTVGGSLVLNVTDFATPSTVPGTLTGTTVIEGKVSAADLADGIRVTLPVGKIVSTASASITNYSASSSGSIQLGSETPGTISGNGSYTLATPGLSGAVFTINVSIPAAAGSFDYVITLTTQTGPPQPVGYMLDGTLRSIVTDETTPSPTGTNDGTQFNLLGRGGYLSANGVLGFPGTLKVGGGITSLNNQGYWKDDGSGVKRLVRSSDAMPGTGGALLDSLPTIPVPGLNSTGNVTLLGALRIGTGTVPVTSADDTAMWTEAGGYGLQLLARENDAVPSISGAFINSFAFGCYANATLGGGLGEAAFAIKMKGATTDSAILRCSITGVSGGVLASTPTVLAREKAAAPGTSEVFGVLNSTLGAATRMDPEGTIVFEAQIKPSGKFGLWYQIPAGSVTKLYAAGDIAPGTSSATFSTFEMPSMGSGGTVAFRAFLNKDGDNATNAKNDGIWRGAVGGVFTPILRRGDAALPGMPVGSKVGNPWSGWLNLANHGAWRGWVDTAGDGISPYPADTFGIYTDIGGTMRLLISSGDAAPGIAGATMFFIDHPVVSGHLAGSEYVSFLSTVTGGGVTANVNDKGVWRSANGGAPTLLLRTGDTMVTSQGSKTVFNIDLPGSNMDVRPWELPVMDDTGRLLLIVTFTDGSTSQVIAQ